MQNLQNIVVKTSAVKIQTPGEGGVHTVGDRNETP